MEPSPFTPTERRILKLLSDGGMHSRTELLGCLYDSLSGPPALRVAICDLNKKLTVSGSEIVCRSLGKYTVRYQHIIRLKSANSIS